MLCHHVNTSRPSASYSDSFANGYPDAWCARPDTYGRADSDIYTYAWRRTDEHT